MTNAENADQRSPLVLAYLGDAVFELLVREKLTSSGKYAVSELSVKAKEYVTAVNQSKAVDALIPLLTEEEEAVFKRGRNAKTAHSPKSAAVIEYRRATGVEALFGWLYAKGDVLRAKELFNQCFPDKD